MKFTDYLYTRPDKDQFIALADKALADLNAADSAQKQLDVLKAVQKASLSIQTMVSLCHVRHSVDTSDSFYEEENEYCENLIPVVEEKLQRIGKAILASPYRAELEKALGKKAFMEVETSVKGISEDIIELMAEDSKLANQYQKLNAAAKIDFMGQTLNIAELGKYKVDKDRSVRRAAFEAEAGYYKEHYGEYDSIFQALVKNRTQQAKRLGYDSFTQVGYFRMGRLGYGPEEVKKFRDSVVADLVPVVTKMKANQAKRVGLDHITYIDDTFNFMEGNPTPAGTPDELLANAIQMYKEMSPETEAFISFMEEHNLFDLVAKKNKRLGGFCTFMPDYKSPFIFSNFNGTDGDVDVLTHEAGHAFNAYINRDKELFGNTDYTMEVAETHSMSMEFFTEPWYHLFFADEKETARYKLSHVEGCMSFIPYGCMVDEFQHYVYDNPDSSIDDKNKKWLELEGKYRPYIDFDELPHFGDGRGWQRQLHIYVMPFYYIDYCLAQTMALQFFMLMNKDREDAWKKYMHFMDYSCNTTFTDLIQQTHMASPFTEGSLKETAAFISKWIDGNQD